MTIREITTQLCLNAVGTVELDDRGTEENASFPNKIELLLVENQIELTVLIEDDQPVDTAEIAMRTYHAVNEATGAGYHAHLSMTVTLDELRQLHGYLGFMLNLKTT